MKDNEIKPILITLGMAVGVFVVSFVVTWMLA